MRIVEDAGGMVARLVEFNPYHDAKGKFAPKVGHAATNTTLIPSEAADALARGESPTILPEDVGATMDALANRTDNPDLTELRVEGTLKFGGDGLGLSRADMPQMPENRREEYMADLARRGIGIDRIDIDPQTLHPMQREISAPASARIMQAMRDGTYRTSNRLTVSSDHYVLDGHHRWGAGTAYSFEKPGFTMPIERVHLDHSALLEDARKWTEANGIANKAFGQGTLGEARIEEFNPNHDQKGKFAAKDGPAALGLEGFIKAQAAAEAPMKSAYADWREGLSPDEVHAIEHWQHAHTMIADSLRYPETVEPGQFAKVQPAIHALDSAIGRAELPHDLTLYRGMQGNPGHMVGRVLRDKSFISTTDSLREARSFSGHNTLLVISAHKGQHAAYLPGIGGHQDHESEFLLPRNARIKITGHSPNLDDGTQVFTGEYVP